MILSHLGILVPSVERAAIPFAEKNILVNHTKKFENEGTQEKYIGSFNTHSALPLLIEAFKEGPYQSAMKRRGPGIHHFGIDVLNRDEFLKLAMDAGWRVHPLGNTMWLMHSGVPLIEVQQCNPLMTTPPLIQKISFPMSSDQLHLFEKIGLGSLITSSKMVSLTIANNMITIDQML